MIEKEIAKRLRDARERVVAIPALSNEFPSLTLKDGYAIQNIGREAALGEGEQLVGYKMGLTSLAKQRDVQVFEPIRGYLLASQEIAKGGTVTTRDRIHPRVEPEVAIVLKHELHGPGVTLRQVRDSIAHIFPALEILDSRFEGFSFRLADVVADNTSASGYMLGREDLLPMLSDLCLLGVSMRKNGILLETGAPGAVLGDPLLSVMALANGLAEEQRSLTPGMMILTGGITASLPFAKGDWIEVAWPSEILTFRAV